MGHTAAFLPKLIRTGLPYLLVSFQPLYINLFLKYAMYFITGKFRAFPAEIHTVCLHTFQKETAADTAAVMNAASAAPAFGFAQLEKFLLKYPEPF